MKVNIELEGRAHPKSEFGNSVPTGLDREGGYPSFVFYYDEEREFPETGTMTIKYRVLKSDKDVRRDKDSQYSCTICVEEIVAAKRGGVVAPAQRDKSAEESLDALAAEKSKENEEGDY